MNRPVVGVLGTTVVQSPALGAGGAARLSARKERGVLAMLALHLGTAVPADQLADALWHGQPPRSAGVTLQGYVAQLRRVLEPDRAPRSDALVLRTTAAGYLLDLPHDNVDAHAFADRVAVEMARWRHALVPPWSPIPPDKSAAANRSISDLSAGLASWRGPAYADLEDHPAMAAERAKLDELRAAAAELAACLRIGLGEHVQVIGELERLALTDPLRESVWALHALALARAGRQSDALGVLRRLSDTLVEELGIDLSPPAERLRRAVLRQDPEFGLGWAGQDGPSPVLPAVTFLSGALVGYQAELEQIGDTLDDAAAGRGHTVVLTGELGIGKSRLAEEVARTARARGMEVLEVEIPQACTTPSLWPIRKLVSQCQERFGGTIPTIAAPDENGEFVAAELFYYLQDVTEMVCAAGAHRPLLVVIHDLQRCDLHTRRAVRRLVEAIPRARVVLLLTQQSRIHPLDSHTGLSAALARAEALRIELRGLDAAGVAQLARSIAGLDLRPDEAEELRRRTGGNPLYVIDLARTGDPLAAVLPDSLVDLIEDSIHAMPTEVVSLLTAAAAIGVEFDLNVLARVAESLSHPIAHGLELATSAHLIGRSGETTFRFRHEVVRDVLQAGASEEARAAIADEVLADALRADADARRAAAEHPDKPRFRLV